MPQLLEQQTLPVVKPAFVHIVTLINRRTGDEKSFEVVTLTDRFTDVIREVSHLRAVHKLYGYEIFETIDCNNPF
jgi:hypothetical protein